MASYAYHRPAPGKAVANFAARPKGMTISQYLSERKKDRDYKAKNPTSTTNRDGSPRTEVGDKMPALTKEQFDKGYTYVATGKQLVGGPGPGGSGDGSRHMTGMNEARWSTEWTLRPPAAKPSENKAPASSNNNESSAKSRFEPTKELKESASQAQALERAKVFQQEQQLKTATQDTTSPFARSGDGIFSQVTRMGDQALLDYNRFTVPLANERARLGALEVGESLAFNTNRLRDDITLPKTWDVAKYLDLVDQFSRKIG